MTTDEVLSAEEVARKEAKKLKKEAKKKLQEAEAQTEEKAADEEQQPTEETEEERRIRKEMKKKKKEEKKRKEAEAENEQTNQNSKPSSSSSSSSSSSPSSSSSSTARKNFYSQHSSVSTLSESDVAKIRGEHKMRLTGNFHGNEKQFYPLSRFDQAGYSKDLLKVTDGFANPTAIQSQAWPVLLSGRDCIAIAETGSGKTLGFTMPGCVHVLDSNKSKPISTKRSGKDASNMGPISLILAPTRELAMQTAEVAEKACNAVGLSVACIYGGVDKYTQRQALAKGVHVMVATPGRLLSLLEEGEVTLNRVTYLVLDEADRMLDLGFEPDIRAIIKQCPDSSRRQTLMFSATWPEIVQKLASEFIIDPLRITIGQDEDQQKNDVLQANKRIKQHVEVLEPYQKDNRLIQLLQQFPTAKPNAQGKKEKILLFVLYKKEVGQLERLLQNKGFNAIGMSSDKSQADRVTAIEKFKNSQVPILIATDVAGRGLDINDITVVINYSFPLTVEDYVHRIGRTGRGGKSGIAYTFFTKNDKHLSGELINVLREAGEEAPADLMKFGTGVKRKEHSMYGNFYKPDSGEPMKKAQKVVL